MLTNNWLWVLLSFWSLCTWEDRLNIVECPPHRVNMEWAGSKKFLTLWKIKLLPLFDLLLILNVSGLIWTIWWRTECRTLQIASCWKKPLPCDDHQKSAQKETQPVESGTGKKSYCIGIWSWDQFDCIAKFKTLKWLNVRNLLFGQVLLGTR